MILKPIYTLQERYTVMHSKLGISHCMSHAAYRNSLRSSSTRKPNYPEHYFFLFSIGIDIRIPRLKTIFIRFLGSS